MSPPPPFPVKTGLDLRAIDHPLGFAVGPGLFAPKAEVRRLEDVRPSLRDPACTGPDELYAIMMDVGHAEDRDDLNARHLLFGVVTYAAGRLGDEPVRSQGHIHIPSPRNGWSTPEVYEVWRGRAVILMQQRCVPDDPDPGRCFAVEAGPGEVIIVPPGWAHATVSADPATPLTFGAWCDRAYGFDYAGVRAHYGLAFFPVVTDSLTLRWERNPTYAPDTTLTLTGPRRYDEFGLEHGVPIYRQYQHHRDRFNFVPDPQRAALLWEGFTP
ncbi:MAG: glucose-6-phosphate isomerase family protein [Planctomycetota bacterium]